MITDALLSSLLGGLPNPMLDADLIKQGLKLLLYNADTFLQVRRAKLLKEQQSRPSAADAAGKPDAAAEPEKPQPVVPPDAAVPAVPLPPDTGVPPYAGVPLPGLSEFWLRTAENEVDSLLRQLDTHFRMLALKQEQLAKFAEFAPPYMQLAVQNEQREIVQKVQRLSGLMQQISGADYPALAQLNQLL